MSYRSRSRQDAGIEIPQCPIRVGRELGSESARPTSSPWSIGSSVCQRVGVDDVDGTARRVGVDLIEDVGELYLVLVLRHVADMGCADDVVRSKQWMGSVAQRFDFVDVESRHARTPGFQRHLQGSGFDQLCAAGVDEKSRRLHASEVDAGDDTPCLCDQAHVQGHDVTRLEERPLAPGAGVTVRTRASQRRLAGLHQDLHAEGPAVSRHDRADPAVADRWGLGPRCATRRSGSTASRPERHHLLGDLPHRREHEGPR